MCLVQVCCFAAAGRVLQRGYDSLQRATSGDAASRQAEVKAKPTSLAEEHVLLMEDEQASVWGDEPERQPKVGLLAVSKIAWHLVRKKLHHFLHSADFHSRGSEGENEDETEKNRWETRFFIHYH